MQVKATQKFVVTSPRKLRLIVPLVKNLSPSEAFEKMPYIKKRAVEPLRKVIGTAIANAKQLGAKEEDLEFSEIQIGEGPRLKRFRAGARGRAKPYVKRMSHIRVVLKTKEDVGKSSASRSSRTDSTSGQKKGDKTQKKSAKSVKQSA